MRVQGKVIAVTGAGNGVGRAVTLEALRRGARVAAVDVSATGLEETAGSRRRRAALDPRRDITDRAAVATLPADVAVRFGASTG
jgi:NAD(P)-dependent dehydrogenase (short-subunit alcohol dehydrogenase family)